MTGSKGSRNWRVKSSPVWLNEPLRLRAHRGPDQRPWFSFVIENGLTEAYLTLCRAC